MKHRYRTKAERPSLHTLYNSFFSLVTLRGLAADIRPV
jgi:hypothetical protein